MSDVLRDLSRMAFVRAVEANLTAFHIFLSEWPEIALQRLLEALRRGYRVAVLHATEMGYPVDRRLSFEEVCAVGLRLRLNGP